MESNKYYTPELSEFCIGFEYEESIGNDKFVNKVFDIHTILRGLTQCSGNNYTVGNYIKVKYLDKEDLEELGFVKDIRTLYPCNFTGSFKNEKEYYLEYKPFIPEFNLNELLTILKLDLINKKHETIFKGTIKNKCELQKILKQLGITNG
jgi:hypothetical protein